jgi:hypothetical protein
MKHRVLKGTRRLKYDTVPRRRDGQVICMGISRNIDKPFALSDEMTSKLVEACQTSRSWDGRGSLVGFHQRHGTSG